MKNGLWYEGIDENTWYEIVSGNEYGDYKYLIQSSDYDYEMQILVKSLDAFKEPLKEDDEA